MAVAAPGDEIDAGGMVAVVESMKMEHVVSTPEPGVVVESLVGVGETIVAGAELVVLGAALGTTAAVSGGGSSEARHDLDDLRDRRAATLDSARPHAVERRHESGRRTARENIADLVDDGSFIEFGPLAIASQRRRRDLDDLIARTPADGLVGGIATVNADRFGPEASECGPRSGSAFASRQSRCLLAASCSEFA